MTSDPLAITTNQTSGRQLVEGSGREDIIVMALQECQAKIDAGESVDRKAMLEKYAEIRDELSACLDGLELMRKDAQSNEPKGNQGTSSASIAPLATLGDFRIVGELGRGGMGVVYEAEQLSIGRRVALKVLPYASMLDKRRIARFQNEARAAATLEHPHIVPVYFVGNERGVYYYAMRLIDGKNLSEVLVELRNEEQPNGSLSKIASRLTDSPDRVAQSNPEHDAAGAETVRNSMGENSTRAATYKRMRDGIYFQSIARVAQQAATALEFAHSHGIIHRDIKPANIMLDELGDAWIADFGLARIESDGGMTMTGDLLGTLRYMSPEQTLAKRVTVDHRSDVYSLGASLYELATLQPLFDGDDRATLLRKITFEEPKAPSAVRPTIPYDLETIILKSLRKNPEDRYATAQEFADDLQRFLSHEPVKARRTPLTQRARMWARRHPTLVAATVIVCTVCLISTAAIGFLVAKHERDALTKQQAANTKQRQVNKKLDEALGAAKVNLQRANAERERAEANLALAIQAVEQTYLSSIGQERLLRIGVRTEFAPPLQPKKLLTNHPRASSGVKFSQIAQRPTFTEQERNVVRRGLEFYDQIARLNPTNPQTQFQSAKAFSRLALLHGGLDENVEAKAAYVEAIYRLKSLTAQHPNSAEYFVELARAYYQQGRLNKWWPDAEGTFDEAIAAARMAIQIEPENVEALRLRGRANLCLHRYASASDDFAQVVDLQRQDAEARYELSQALEESGDLENAVAQLKRCVDLTPANESYRKALASLYRFGLKDREAAGAVFEPLLEAELSPLDEVELRATKAAYQGRAKEVVKFVDEFNRLGGKSFETYFWRGRSHIWLKNIDQAKADLQAAMELATSDQEFREIAAQYHRIENDDEAISAWNRAEELNPNNYDFFKERGLIYLESGEYRKAFDDIQRFVQLVPNKDQYAYLYKRLGRLNFELGNYQDSLQCIETAFELDPNDVSAVNYFKETLGSDARLRHPDWIAGHKALLTHMSRRYDELIEFESHNGKYWHGRAVAKWLLGELNEALHDNLRAVDLRKEENEQSEYAYCLYHLSEVYRALGRHKEASETLSTVVTIRVNDPNSGSGVSLNFYLHALARSFSKREMFDEATDVYRRIVDTEPTSHMRRNIIAWHLATSGNDEIRNGELAVRFAIQACELSDWEHAGNLDTLAAAYAEAGDFDEAVKWQSKAIERAPEMEDEFNPRLKLYAQGFPYRQGE